MLAVLPVVVSTSPPPPGFSWRTDGRPSCSKPRRARHAAGTAAANQARQARLLLGFRRGFLGSGRLVVLFGVFRLVVFDSLHRG